MEWGGMEGVGGRMKGGGGGEIIEGRRGDYRGETR